MNRKAIQNYYNNFMKYQISSGVNDRIHSLYKRLLAIGMHRESNVLELGCGIGAMTYLLSRKVRTGRIEAVDISDHSIAFARSKIKRKNIEFYVDDITSYTPKLSACDYILLFDVLEHIPTVDHPRFFANLAEIAIDKTKILINIPNPEYIKYDLRNNREVLQIIDQPIPLTDIVKNANENGLEILKFETYSVWVEDDYQFIMLRKNKEFDENKLSDQRNILQKVGYKLKWIYLSWKYRYK